MRRLRHDTFMYSTALSVSVSQLIIQQQRRQAPPAARHTRGWLGALLFRPTSGGTTAAAAAAGRRSLRGAGDATSTLSWPAVAGTARDRD